MATLHVAPGHGDAYTLSLPEGRLVIGRSTSVDVVIANGYLSRRHSEIFHQDGQLMVRDLGSRNGTRVNGTIIDQPKVLKDGDRVEISGAVITISSGQPAAAAEPPVVDSSEGTVFLPASELLAKYVSRSAAKEADADLERLTQRLRILNEVHQALAASIEREELLELILDRAFDHLEPQQGTVFLRSSEGKFQRVAGRKTANVEDYLHSATLVDEVADKGMAALVLDAQTDQRFGGAESILSSGVRSLIAAPLLCPEGSLGMIALNSTLNVRQFNQDDLELLSSLAAVAASRLWSLSLAEEAAERRRLGAELDLARRIQMALLPEELPTLPGYDLEAVNVPSRGVSGDLYQVLLRAEGNECMILVADVSGKGMAASLLTATIEALAAAPIREGQPPDQICGLVSRLLEERTPSEKFATALLAALEPESGCLIYANAGHNPALLVRANGEVEQLKRTGIPLGLLPQASYEAREVELAPGDSLVVYTDGITEAANQLEEEYGTPRLAAVCQRERSKPLKELMAAIESDLASFVAGEPFADDRTLIVLRRRV